MKKKDLIIGGILISAVVVSGLVGLSFILYQSSQEGNGVPTEGLPLNWNTAPNSSYFILNNQTTEKEITLKDILDGVRLTLEEEQVSGNRINEDKDLIYYYEFYYQDYLVAGVDFLNILEKFDTHFAYNLSFSSKTSSEKIYITTEKIIDKMYEGSEDPIVLLIAANGKWLANSPLGGTHGNFSIIGQNWGEQLFNLDTIEVLSNWTIPVEVNGTVEFSITPSNCTINEYIGNYSYDRFDYWNFNRQYWGRNISDIIKYTSAAGKNYTVKFYAADGVVAPYPLIKLYDQDDIEKGIEPPWKSPEDLVNTTLSDPGVPLPKPDKLMCLVYKQQEFGECGLGTCDPPWKNPKMCGYGSGPFYVLVPGRPRGEYLKYVTKIELTIT
ncbi:MAG: hypothetical protein ACQERB_15230 [Promethearchaeati archaeon]